jgi:predicted MFS family arabinose efflux permease
VSEAKRLGAAGFLAIAVAFGSARNGYGLFLPDFRDEFGLSVELSGFIASGLQAGYLIALAIVGLSVARTGPRLPVMIGGLSAAAGMVLVAFAPSAAVLAAGVILAGTSAGWSWAPYNDAASRALSPRVRDRVLSIVSTGTTFGILVTGAVALAAGSSWRFGWLAFSATALVAAVLNAFVLPGAQCNLGGEEEVGGRIRRPTSGYFLRAGSGTLFFVAICFGLVTAFYWSFAVELIASRGGFVSGSTFYIVLGVAGFAGLLTGDAVSRFGLRPVMVGIMASLSVAAFLLGAGPGWWPAVGISAALYGADVMLGSALLAVWSSAVFSERPSTGFSLTLVFFGAGSIVGPTALGLLGGEFGLDTAFLVASVIAALTMFARVSSASDGAA